jgi:hypothetical protein
LQPNKAILFYGLSLIIINHTSHDPLAWHKA